MDEVLYLEDKITSLEDTIADQKEEISSLELDIAELENATGDLDIDEIEFVLQDYKELKTLLLTKVKPSDLMLGLTHYLKNIL